MKCRPIVLVIAHDQRRCGLWKSLTQPSDFCAARLGGAAGAAAAAPNDVTFVAVSIASARIGPVSLGVVESLHPLRVYIDEHWRDSSYLDSRADGVTLRLYLRGALHESAFSVLCATHRLA